MKEEDQKVITKVVDTWNEYYGKREGWQCASMEDWQIYLGDQWAFVPEAARLRAEGRPELSLNITKKQVDLIEGLQRQNRSDLRTLPMEGGDETGADVYSQLLRWCMQTRGGHQAVSMAFKDAVVSGLGIVHPFITYEDDILNGEIKIVREDPYRILFDPYMTQPDLSDCFCIMRHSYLKKEKAKLLWPDRAKDIEKVNGSPEIQLGPMFEDHGKSTDKINIRERWYRKTEERKFIYLEEEDVVKPFPRKIDDINLFAEKMVSRGFKIISGDVSVIKLQIIAEEQLVIYTGDSPYSWRKYPFIPVFCYFEPTCSNWQWRMQGVVRALKDVQVEKNKRRSQWMNAILSMPHAGFMRKRGSNIDINQIKQLGPKLIDVDDFDDLKEITMNDAKQPLMLLEQANDADINRIGLNPDLVGAIGGSSGGSAASAAGVSLNLRLKQGLTSIQAIFDNLKNSQIMLGNNLIELVDDNYSVRKIARICGDNIQGMDRIKKVDEQLVKIQAMPAGTPEELQAQQEQYAQIAQVKNMMQQAVAGFWNDFEDKMGLAAYDCVIEEGQNSPTHRAEIQMKIETAMHQGHPVTQEMWLEYLDIPPAVKEKWLASIEEQRRAVIEMEERKTQMEMAKEKNKVDAQIQTAMINKSGEN